MGKRIGLVFEAKVKSGEPQNSDELDDVKFYSKDDLIELLDEGKIRPLIRPVILKLIQES